MKALDEHYNNYDEPLRSLFPALQELILSVDESLRLCLKYGMPCFSYQGKPLCYLWYRKETLQPYILFADGNKMKDKALLAEGRKRMKIYLIDAAKDLDVVKIECLVKEAIGVKGKVSSE